MLTNRILGVKIIVIERGAVFISNLLVIQINTNK